MTPDTLDVEGLEKVARAATPGPWTGEIVPEHYPECDDADTPYVVTSATGRLVVYLPEHYVGNCDQHELDGEHIATFDPPTVLALLSLIKTQEARIAELEADKARLDWLETQEVEVRVGLPHGSRHVFYAKTDDSYEGEIGPSDIRAKVDRSLLSSPKPVVES